MQYFRKAIIVFFLALPFMFQNNYSIVYSGAPTSGCVFGGDGGCGGANSNYNYECRVVSAGGANYYPDVSDPTYKYYTEACKLQTTGFSAVECQIPSKGEMDAMSGEWLYSVSGIAGSSRKATSTCGGGGCPNGSVCMGNFGGLLDSGGTGYCFAVPVDFKNNACSVSLGVGGCTSSKATCFDEGIQCTSAYSPEGVCTQCGDVLNGITKCNSNTITIGKNCCKPGFACYADASGEFIPLGASASGTCKEEATNVCAGTNGVSKRLVGENCSEASQCISNICQAVPIKGKICQPIPNGASCDSNYAACSPSACSDGYSCKPDNGGTYKCTSDSECVPSYNGGNPSSTKCTITGPTSAYSNCCNAGINDGDSSNGVELLCSTFDNENLTRDWGVTFGSNQGVCTVGNSCVRSFVPEAELDDIKYKPVTSVDSYFKPKFCSISRDNGSEFGVAPYGSCCNNSGKQVFCSRDPFEQNNPLHNMHLTNAPENTTTDLGLCIEDTRACANHLEQFNETFPCCASDATSGKDLVPGEDGKCYYVGESSVIEQASCSAEEDGTCGVCPNPYHSCTAGLCAEDAKCSLALIEDIVYRGPIVNIETLLSTAFGFLYPLGIGIGVFFIIKSGYCLMTSEGEPNKVKDCQEQLTHAVLGTLFIILSIAILRVIINSLLPGLGNL